MSIDDDLVFVDVETTGGNANWNRVIEVGLVRSRGALLIEEWSTLVNPLTTVPSTIESLTGIDSAMVSSAPTFADIATELHERMNGCLFVAHNARFDYGFIRNEFRRVGIEFKSKVLCTVKLSRQIFPDERRHNLDAVMRRHGLGCDARHRALGDARVLYDFLQVLRGQIPGPDLAAAVESQLQRPSLPPHLPSEAVEGIPDAPGVYRFFGPDDRLLYVGKSVNLRTRVMAHFSADHRSAKEMRLSQQVRRIEWEETAGELGALLKESREVKNTAPLMNRRLRRKKDLFTLLFDPGADPGKMLDIVELRIGDRQSPADLFGIFESRRKARNWLERAARDAQLCPKRLGLEKGGGPCFSYQLKRCPGVCAGMEPGAAHDLRLMQQLLPKKLRSWPFAGRIGIREIGLFGDADIHVFDRWCYIGSAANDDQLWPLLDRREPLVFDPDCYRILSSFLKRKNFRPSILDLDGRHRPRPQQLDLM